MSLLLEILGPRYGFEGGLFLTEHKAQTARRPIRALPVEDTLSVPLTVRRDLPTEPLVCPGQRVLRGQPLARPIGKDAVPVHAPTSGTVVGTRRAWTVRDGFVPCADLRPDGQDEAMPRSEGWAEESFVAELVERGVFCSAPRAPLHALLHQAAALGTAELIINAMETEPYLTADLRTVVEESGRLIDATGDIADAIGAMHVYFALPFRHHHMVRRMEAEARGRFIEIVPLANKYPQCNPVVLVKTLLDRDVPPGGSPLDVGALVLPLAVVRMAAEALLDGRPVTHVLMTVAGDAIEQPGTYRVAIGTPLRDVARRVGLSAFPQQLIWGGPLTGISLERDDGVVTIDTTALLAFRDAQRASPVPCIRCGWCVDDCPVGLDPSTLLHLEAEDACGADDLAQLQACVACGVCSHVCPSHLPLAQSLTRTRGRFEGRV